MNYNLLKQQDFLTEYTRLKPDILEFLLKLTRKAIDSNRNNIIYNPKFPKYQQFSNGKIHIKQWINTIQKYNKDVDLPFDDLTYQFIVFSIYATPIRFKREEFSNLSEIEHYKVCNTYKKEQEFKSLSNKNNVTYLFHGSRLENWYSIMKNGIRNCSGSNLQLHGAAYGQGIYLTDSIGMAMTYAHAGPDGGIIGVFEVINAHTKYKKTSQIFVVPNEKHVILRYFICYDYRNKNIIHQKINNYFANDIHVNKRQMKKINNNLSSSRIMKELEDSGGNLTLVDDSDIYKWKAIIPRENFAHDSKIRSELKKYSIPHVEFEIRISEEYPFEPPFIRIVSPSFIIGIGSMLEGGGICLASLSLDWSPALGVKKLLLQITSEMVDAEINALEKNTPSDYTYKNAHASYTKQGEERGWFK